MQIGIVAYRRLTGEEEITFWVPREFGSVSAEGLFG